MKQPFFSICIPTYNRAKDLRVAISVCLRQTCRNFELIISDNASTDETEKVVKSFKDERIRYFKNKINIGSENNFQKVFSYASGEYIFSMGDDDFILFDDTLAKIKEILEKEPFGLLRLNSIEKKFIGHGLCKSMIIQEENIRIEKNAPAEKIIDFFNKTAVGHVAGLVIKNSPDIAEKMIDCSVTPWIKVIYEKTKKDGAYFLANHYTIITWSQGDILTHYNVLPGNHLMFEKYTNFIFPLVGEAYKRRYFQSYILQQPVIKLYSNNNNLIKFDQRLLELEPRLKRNPIFWLMVGLALVMPKFVWETVRVIQHRQKNTMATLKNRDLIEKRFAYFAKI